MNGDWAARNLQTIRTLMERSALYRRALAPIMIAVGCIGLGAAVLGWKLEIKAATHFVLYWLAVALGAVTIAFFLVRRQALLAREVIWSPPARRVAQAALPSLTAGLLISVVLVFVLPHLSQEPSNLDRVMGMVWLPLGWVILYGCALHAAGFFLPRGMRIFGWAFVIGGCGLFALGIPDLPREAYGHGVMGLFFGLLHQAYGVYLYVTEQKDAAT